MVKCLKIGSFWVINAKKFRFARRSFVRWGFFFFSNYTIYNIYPLLDFPDRTVGRGQQPSVTVVHKEFVRRETEEEVHELYAVLSAVDIDHLRALHLFPAVHARNEQFSPC